ncbi:hypothetical protein FHS55_003141 [Angulomicrobium tetraedrale]|uniref:Uncharacterized protein n=1 Tax=Ancylobacter tetraedralis TaxID=217068 RepID=A0A839ZCI1_9HYPH|nr:hypothetical protein [Ancylobacter tetraedralis]
MSTCLAGEKWSPPDGRNQNPLCLRETQLHRAKYCRRLFARWRTLAPTPILGLSHASPARHRPNSSPWQHGQDLCPSREGGGRPCAGTRPVLRDDTNRGPAARPELLRHHDHRGDLRARLAVDLVRQRLRPDRHLMRRASLPAFELLAAGRAMRAKESRNTNIHLMLAIVVEAINTHFKGRGSPRSSTVPDRGSLQHLMPPPSKLPLPTSPLRRVD